MDGKEKSMVGKTWVLLSADIPAGERLLIICQQNSAFVSFRGLSFAKTDARRMVKNRQSVTVLLISWSKDMVQVKELMGRAQTSSYLAGLVRVPNISGNYDVRVDRSRARSAVPLSRRSSSQSLGAAMHIDVERGGVMTPQASEVHQLVICGHGRQ